LLLEILDLLREFVKESCGSWVWYVLLVMMTLASMLELILEGF